MRKPSHINNLAAEYSVLIHYTEDVFGRNSREAKEIKDCYVEQMQEMGYHIRRRDRELRRIRSTRVSAPKAFMKQLEPQLRSWMIAEIGPEALA